MVQADNDCNVQCEKLWDGYGRWNSPSKWSPDLREVNLHVLNGTLLMMIFFYRSHVKFGIKVHSMDF